MLRTAWPGLLAGPVALAIYARLIPYGLTWAHNGADGGDLLAAALTGGIPHPPGYPTYQLLLRFAIWIHPGDAARAGAWLSAVCAACAAAVLTDLARRVALTQQPHRPQLAAAAAFIAGLTWALSPLVWRQATVVEVYALNALFFVALLWLLWRWAEAVDAGGSETKWLTVAGLIFGLGLGNHLTLALILPGALYWIRTKGRARVSLGRTVAFAALAMLAGLLVYAYLPLAAARRPPINWGDPVTLNRFLWVVTGRLYAPLAFGLPLVELPARLGGWATLTVTQFAPWGFVLALVGLWQLDRRLRAWWTTTLLVWSAFTIYAIGYNSTDSDAYLLPAFAVMALWLAEGLAALFARFAPQGRQLVVAGAVALLVVALIPAFFAWEDRLLTADWQAQYTAAALNEVEPGAVILAATDRQTFALWYATLNGPASRPDVAVINVNLYGFDWYRRTLAETHPHLLPSAETAAPLETLVEGWLAERPVYAAEDVGLPLRLGAQTPSGGLTRVVGTVN